MCVSSSKLFQRQGQFCVFYCYSSRIVCSCARAVEQSAESERLAIYLISRHGVSLSSSAKQLIPTSYTRALLCKWHNREKRISTPFVAEPIFSFEERFGLITPHYCLANAQKNFNCCFYTEIHIHARAIDS